MMRSRPGSALIAAIVVLVILDCVVLGTLHLATLERRLVRNVETALQLRLAASSAAQATLAHWPAAAATMGVREHRDLPAAPDATGLLLSVRLERIGERLFLISAEAALPPPRIGRARIGLLAVPPALSAEVDVAAAAVSTAASPRLGTTARISHGEATCGAAGVALYVDDWIAAATMPRDGIDGTVAVSPGAARPQALIDRLAPALRSAPDSAVRFIDGDYELTADFEGVLVVTGELRIHAGVTVRGLVFSGGLLHLAAGATIEGGLHSAGETLIDGSVRRDRCLTSRLLARTGITSAHTLPGRSVVPVF